MASRNNEQGFVELALLIVLTLILAGVGFYAYQQSQNAKRTAANPPAANNAAKHPGVVQAVQLSTAVDAKGLAVAPKTAFAPSEAKINAVVQLKGAKKDARFEYVRYRDNKFVDNGSVKVAKEAAQTAQFKFALKPGRMHPKGNYMIKVYTNGVFEKAVRYSVQ
jgi:hypothetical protein